MLIIRNSISYLRSSEIPTVNAENIVRNTFQQTVRTDKNSRNDNNWSRLPKEDGSAIGKNLIRQRRETDIKCQKLCQGRTSIYKRDYTHQPTFPMQVTVLLKT